MSLVVSDKSLIIAQGRKKKMAIYFNKIKHFMSMVFWGTNMGDAMIFSIWNSANAALIMEDDFNHIVLKQ